MEIFKYYYEKFDTVDQLVSFLNRHQQLETKGVIQEDGKLVLIYKEQLR